MNNDHIRAALEDEEIEDGNKGQLYSIVFQKVFHSYYADLNEMGAKLILNLFNVLVCFLPEGVQDN